MVWSMSYCLNIYLWLSYIIRILYYLPMERMTKEELEKELEKLKDFKVYVFEWDVYVKAEDFRKKAIECRELREENKKLKKECEENDYLVEDNARWMKKCEEKIMEIKKLRKDLGHSLNSLWVI